MREFKLAGDEAILRQEGDRLIVEALVKRGLLATLATLQSTNHQSPMISLSPSITRAISSADAVASRRPIRSIARVRT